MQRQNQPNRRSHALELLVSCCCLVALVAAATGSASSATPAKKRPNDECMKPGSRPDVTLLTRTSSRAFLRGSARTTRNTRLMTARPNCGGAGMRACWPDSEHFARASLHMEGWIIYGYWVYYGRTGGYELGAHNNEIVFTGHGIAHYASPDWGPPGMWHYRDARDLYVGPGGGVNQYLIYHAFDRQWSDDDACVNPWYF